MPKNWHASDSDGHTQGRCNSTPEPTVPCRRTSTHQTSNARGSKEASITFMRKASSMSMKRRSRRTAPRPQTRNNVRRITLYSGAARKGDPWRLLAFENGASPDCVVVVVVVVVVVFVVSALCVCISTAACACQTVNTNSNPCTCRTWRRGPCSPKFPNQPQPYPEDHAPHHSWPDLKEPQNHHV